MNRVQVIEVRKKALELAGSEQLSIILMKIWDLSKFLKIKIDTVRHIKPMLSKRRFLFQKAESRESLPLLQLSRAAAQSLLARISLVLPP